MPHRLTPKLMTIPFLAAICLLALALTPTQSIFPPPTKRVELSKEQFLHITNVCAITQNVNQVVHKSIFASAVGLDSEYYLRKILKRENGNRHCTERSPIVVIDLEDQSNQNQQQSRPKSQEQQLPINMQIEVDPIVVTNKQGYKIITQKQSPQIRLIVQTYSGYIYALESLFQMIDQKTGELPLGIVQDQPAAKHRGIMIDSARHFLKVTTIERLIESMPLSKLNILHWHFADDESFSLKLDSHPEFAESTAFKSKLYYTTSQVRDLIALGKKNGVSIIPEFQTPAHVRAWGQPSKWKAQNITIKCPGGEGYNAQFDLSKHIVYELAQEVLRQIETIFRDSPYIHMGGDQVFGSCWDLRPAIKTFMTIRNIKDYDGLLMFWRNQMKQALTANRTVVYWQSNRKNTSTAANDIVQYWGKNDETEQYVLYLSSGFGNIWWNKTAGVYSVWKGIYQNFNLFAAKGSESRVIGGQVALWGQVSNDDTLENNLWMRASAFAAKVWSTEMQPISEVVRSLVGIMQDLHKMGVGASAVTSQFCQKKPEICFPQ